MAARPRPEARRPGDDTCEAGPRRPACPARRRSARPSGGPARCRAHLRGRRPPGPAHRIAGHSMKALTLYLRSRAVPATAAVVLGCTAALWALGLAVDHPLGRALAALLITLAA